MGGFSFFRPIVFCAIAAVFAASCASSPVTVENMNDLERRAEEITVTIRPLTSMELKNYEEVGPIQCDVFWRSNDRTSAEICRSILRGEAAEKNANLVVIERSTKQVCETSFLDDVRADCIKMRARAYRVVSGSPARN